MTEDLLHPYITNNGETEEAPCSICGSTDGVPRWRHKWRKDGAEVWHEKNKLPWPHTCELGVADCQPCPYCSAPKPEAAGVMTREELTEWLCHLEKNFQDRRSEIDITRFAIALYDRAEAAESPMPDQAKNAMTEPKRDEAMELAEKIDALGSILAEPARSRRLKIAALIRPALEAQQPAAPFDGLGELDKVLGPLVEHVRGLKRELARTREALRKQCVDEADPSVKFQPSGGCMLCEAEMWNPGEPERHRDVTLTVNGVETTGPCPAKLPDPS